jgi:peptide/nickel transport system substrate-binding protein
MVEQGSYWKPDHWMRRSLSRRQALRTLGSAAGGLAAISLVGCGGDDGDDSATRDGAQSDVDSTKGRPGGRFVHQTAGDAGTIVLVTGAGEGPGAYTHSSLVTFAHGRKPPEGADGLSLNMEPDQAQALPEQPDNLTYVFKLIPANFHNGKPLTASDVKYSIERYAFHPQTRTARFFVPWLDKVEAPDASTVKVTTKAPFTDVLQVFGAFLRIMSQEHEEGPDASNRLMGAGPFLFDSTQPPVITRFKKNPNYFMKPYPYFDEVHLLGAADDAKELSDFSSGQTHMTYWHPEEQRDRFKEARPDATLFAYPYPSMGFYVRVDQEPFKDKRVRQALSMALNRDRYKQAVSNGEGDPDQALSWIFPEYGFRKPSELGAAAKSFTYDLQAAKQLLQAANVSLPIKTDMWHWNSTVVGQPYVDGATFIQNSLKEAGIAEFVDHETTHAQATVGWLVGNYDGTCFFVGDGGGFVYNTPAARVQSTWSAPDGNVTAPTDNRPHVINARLTDLAAKQAQELDMTQRKSLFREMEQIIADEMYMIPMTTRTDNFFLDSKVSKNAQIPLWFYGSSAPYVKYWWFDA